MNNFNLLSRLLLIIAGVIALVLGGSTAVFIKEISNQNLNNLKTASESIITPLVNEVYSLVKSSEDYEWALKVQSINANRLYQDHKELGVKEIIVLNSYNEVVAHNNISKIAKPINAAINLNDIFQEGVSRSDDIYWIGNTISKKGEIIGQVIVGFEAIELQVRIRNVLNNSVLLFCVFFTIGLGIAYFFVTRQITRPIKELVTASNAITSGDYYYPVKKKSSDEIGDLASGLQIMQKAIRSKIEDLEQYKAQLETEVEKRTQEFLAAKLEAEQSNQAKSRFLANMSHELRTPLNAVLGFSQILYNKETSSEKLAYLKSINTSGNTLLALINEVLDFSKIESGKMEIQYSSFSPRYLLEEVESMFIQKASEKDLRFKAICDKDVPDYLLCDAFRLKQILMNLCSNAIKFTTEGGVLVQLRTLKESEKSKRVMLEIEVTDTGKGIPKEEQALIFNAFEQAKGQKISEYGGTGLGLAITQKFIKLMQGSIEVKSEGEGKGTIFNVRIPDVEITEQQPDIQSANIKQRKTYKFSPATVLVVDDISYNRDLITSYLSDQPFEILEAEDGVEGLSLLENHKPELILTDLKMPNMDGHQFLQEIQCRYPEHLFTLMLITASVQDSDIAENRDLCHEIIAKPINKETLLSAMSKYMEVEIQDNDEELPEASTISGYLQINSNEARKILDIAELGELQLLEEMAGTLHDLSAQKWLLEQLDSMDFETIITKVSERIDK